MAVGIKEWVELEEKANAPFEARWLAWYDQLSHEQRAEYHTGADLGAAPRPPEPARTHREAIIRCILTEARWGLEPG